MAMPFKAETSKYKVISSDPEGKILQIIEKITEPALTQKDTSIVDLITASQKTALGIQL